MQNIERSKCTLLYSLLFLHNCNSSPCFFFFRSNQAMRHHLGSRGSPRHFLARVPAFCPYCMACACQMHPLRSLRVPLGRRCNNSPLVEIRSILVMTRSVYTVYKGCDQLTPCPCTYLQPPYSLPERIDPQTRRY